MKQLKCKMPHISERKRCRSSGWARTEHMLRIVDTSLSVLMTLRMCLRELCCLFGIFYGLDLNHLVRVFYLFMFS